MTLRAQRVGDICERCTITVRGIDGERRIAAWRLGAWAAHRQVSEPALFCLTLLPTGMSLPLAWASFRHLGAAVGAMREIVCLRNDWQRIGQADLTAALRETLQMICVRHGAVPGPVQAALDIDQGLLGRPLGSRLNGYRLPDGG